MTPPPPRALSTAKKLLFTLISCSILLVTGEGVARVMDKIATTNTTEPGQDLPPHETRIWGLREGTQTAFDATFDVGANGLRVVADTGAPLRALTLGDSSIFGHGLADDGTLHASLRRSLAEAGLDVDVFDGGIPGYSSEQSRVLLEEVGWDLRPNLLVIGNLWSDTGARGFQDREWIAELHSPGFNVQWLLRKSVLWAMIGTKIKQIAAGETGDEVPTAMPGGSLPVTWVKDPNQKGVRRVPIEQYAENLDWMLQQASARGIGAVFISPCNRILAAMTEDRETSWGVYFHTMKAVAERRGVPIVHGCDAAAEGGLLEDAGFLDEMHPTAALNAAYAERLTRALHIRRWPENPLVPNGDLPPWSEPIIDDWKLDD